MSTRAAKRVKGPKTSAPPSGGGKKSGGGQPVSYKSPGKVSEGCGFALACANRLAGLQVMMLTAAQPMSQGCIRAGDADDNTQHGEGAFKTL